MSIKKIDDLVERFCLWLGRYGRWSKLLDSIASAIFPSFVNPLLLPGAVGALAPLSQPVSFMAGIASNQPGVHDGNQGPLAPLAPHAGEPGDPKHSTKECSPAIFHGMHGAPCKFHGGTSDNKYCPAGTTSGLWWRWNIPKVGNVYYVDCCGLPIKWKVWCNWAKEANWCAGQGNNVYTCTLTLLHGELKIDANGFADPVYHVLAGPPAPP